MMRVRSRLRKALVVLHSAARGLPCPPQDDRRTGPSGLAPIDVQSRRTSRLRTKAIRAWARPWRPTARRRFFSTQRRVRRVLKRERLKATAKRCATITSAGRWASLGAGRSASLVANCNNRKELAPAHRRAFFAQRFFADRGRIGLGAGRGVRYAPGPHRRLHRWRFRPRNRHASRKHSCLPLIPDGRPGRIGGSRSRFCPGC